MEKHGIGGSPEHNAYDITLTLRRNGMVRISLTQPETRNRTQQEIADELGTVVKRYNFARTFVIQEQTIGGGRSGGLPVQYVVLAPDFEA